jgi:site-specific recombinase XerD
MNAKVSIVCYRQKTLRNGEHPLMIRVAKNGKRKLKSLGLSINPKHWDFKKNRPLSKCPNRELILKTILEKEAEFQKEIIELTSMQKEYTASSLISSKTNQIIIKSVGSFLAEFVKQLEKTNRINYARSFQHTWNSMKRFCGNNLDFPFADIDVNWLNKYEQWLKNKNCTEVTIAIIFRNIRSIYNRAIVAKCALKNSYPFNEYKISKFDTKTKKRAIPKETIKKIMSVDLSKELYYTQFSRDIFIFSYLCGGINFSDIAQLKFSNLIDNKLMYIRKKTKKEITTPLSNEALQIIQKYSANKSKQSDYIFPILDNKIHKTELQRYNRIHKVLGKINPSLKKVAKLSGIETNLTTYVARHSFATVLKNSGVNVALISETLGHSDIATTQIYLDSFENEQISEAFKNLL